MSRYFFDEDDVRYELYQSNGGEGFNWLIFPGGPGGDSSYMHPFADLLELPGNVWMIDLPGNGSHDCSEYDYDQWLEIFPRVVEKFERPVVVGHSFGGMLPLLYEEMEEKLSALVLLSTTPALWFEESSKYAQQFDLPDLSEDMAAFTSDPNQETFDRALKACLPFYFHPDSLQAGTEALLQVPFPFKPAVWGQQVMAKINYTAKWIPQNVPTLIIGGRYDCICPHTMFKNDPRFQRENIEQVLVEDGGHMPWFEDPQTVKAAFVNFLDKCKTVLHGSVS